MTSYERRVMRRMTGAGGDTGDEGMMMGEVIYRVCYVLADDLSHCCKNGPFLNREDASRYAEDVKAGADVIHIWIEEQGDGDRVVGRVGGGE